MSKKFNPELKPGDRIVLISTPDDSIPFGTRGTVVKDSKTPWGKQYTVKWENGSGLYLLDDDKWMHEDDFEHRKKTIKESISDLSQHSEVVRHFNIRKLKIFLDKLQESGVVNMFAASPYLWMGKDRILNQFRYQDTNDEFDEMLDLSNEAQSIMINGCIEILEKKNKEITPENINRCLERYSTNVLKFWMDHYSKK
jgi:hypothetical protein